MNKQIFSRLMIVSFFVMATFSILIPPASAQDGNSNEKPKASIQPLLTFSDRAVIPGGGSTLVRNSEGVYMSLHSAELSPDTVVTAWWVFFNNPKKCATSPCSVADLSNPEVQSSLVNATGRVVGPDGTADFGAFKAIGDTTGAFTGPGLLNSKKAEIHLVVRTHGPALLDNPELLRQQLSMFMGGCPPNTCANIQVSIHQP
ncbi:MAG TPA: hypothetical protein VFO63_13305 [Blastocatellia bacterium]|nr:hypothetical protein [Blastocatellia bacterium]